MKEELLPRRRRSLVYLLTGGAGFLGHHLLRLLLEKEDQLAELRVFDKHLHATLDELNTDAVKVVGYQGDIKNYDSVLEATYGCDVVIHSASLVDVWYKAPDSLIHAVNVTGTENVIRACVACGVQRLVYTSSMEVIGPNTLGDHFCRGNEDTPYKVNHTMAYPKSKAEAERIVLEANGTALDGGGFLSTCSLRPTGIYGEGHELMRDVYTQTVQKGGLFIGGIPDHVEHGRVYAGNVAWMHILAARALRDQPQKVGGEAFFCYDDSPYKSYENFNMMLLSAFNFRQLRIPGLILWFLALFNDLIRWVVRPVYKFTPILNNYTLSVASTTFTVATDKAERYFGYRPLFSWDQSLARTRDWISTFPLNKSKEA